MYCGTSSMSGCFNVVKLTQIFRQAAESDIIVNAHKINEGEQVALDKAAAGTSSLSAGKDPDVSHQRMLSR